MTKAIPLILSLLCSYSLFSQSNNPRTLYMEEVWDDNTQDWRKSFKHTYAFDDQERQIYFRSYNWNEDRSNWDLYYDTKNTYTNEYTELRIYEKREGSQYSQQILRFDPMSNLIIYQEWLNNDEENNQTWNRQTISYFENGSWDELFEEYNFFTESWKQVTRRFSRVGLDENSCIVSEEIFQSDRPTQLTTTERDEDCRPLVIMKQHWNSNTSGWVNFNLDSLFYNVDFKTTRSYVWDIENEEWILRRIRDEKVTNPMWSESYFFYENSRDYHERYEYDEYGNRTYGFFEYLNPGDTVWRTEFLGTSEWRPDFNPINFTSGFNYIDSLEEWEVYVENDYEYNELGYLDRQELFVRRIDVFDQFINETTISEYEYDYYCNDLRKMETIYQNGSPSTRGHYNYLYPENCNAASENTLNVYPNPSQGLFRIESGLIQEGNAEIIVTNSLGKVLQNIEARELAGYYEIDLASQPNGVYYIWVNSIDGEIERQGKVLKLGR